MGWGVNSKSEDSLGQNIMKQVTLNRITNRTQCEESIKATRSVAPSWKLDDSWICADLSEEVNNDNVLCDGDGGGPLVCQEHGTGRYSIKVYTKKSAHVPKLANISPLVATNFYSYGSKSKMN